MSVERKIKVKDGQTLADVALQYGGSVETMFEIASANGLSVTDEPADGAELRVPGQLSGADESVVRRYALRGVEPATGLRGEGDVFLRVGGIGYMGIEIDFEVL